MNLAIQAFRFAAEPFFFSNAADKNSPKLFASVNHYFIIVTSFILLAVTINLDILKYLVGGEAYYEGLQVVPLLLLGYLFLGVYYNISIWFKLTDKTYYGTIITICGALITIILNYLLIPVFGYVGSSWAALACYFSMTVSCYITGQRNYPIPYQVLGAVGYLFFAITLIFISNQFTFDNQLLATGFHSILLAGFLLVAYLIERKKIAFGH
jgi:O-antigen/teichoic acid export membrane protein